MSIPEEVILDLLPAYLAGEVSPRTRAWVEEYLAQDPALAEQVRPQLTDFRAARLSRQGSAAAAYRAGIPRSTTNQARPDVVAMVFSCWTAYFLLLRRLRTTRL